MKYTVLLFFVFLFIIPAFNQSAYEDALELAAIYRKHGNSFKPLTRTDASDETILDLGRFLEILYRHYDTIWGPTKTPTANNLISSYRDNNFFLNYELPAGVNDAASALALKVAAENRLTKVESGGVPSSGLNVATLADGIAKFLVKRTREELTVAFFEEFRQTMAKNQQLEILFPATRMILLGIGDQIYNFNAYIGSLREAFQADFKRIPFSLESLLTQTNTTILKDSIPVYYVADLFKTTRMLLDKSSINDVIAYLGRDANFQQQQAPFEKANIIKIKSALRLLHLVAESVQAYGFDNRPFIQPVKFKNLLKDQIANDFYLGLVYEKARNTSIGSLNLAETLNSESANRFLTVVGSFIETGERLHNIKTGILSGEFQKNDSLLYFQYFDYIQVAIDLINTTRNFIGVVFPSEQQCVKELDNACFVLNRISSVTLDVRRKHYANAVIHTGLLVSELVLSDKDFSCPLLRFGAFMAAISESRNSDDVAAVMETFALPKGSSYIKKHYPFNLSIGSYVGFNAGIETLQGLEDEDKTGLNAGLGAPIGINFSWALESRRGNSPGAFSVYLNVVDIGAFTAYRFTNNDAVNDLPALKFDNIFAPGGALIYSLPKFPGAISFFTQRGPSLRKVTDDGYEIDQTNGWRMGLAFSVDIPLFNLYTEGKKFGCGYAPPD